MKMRQRPTFDLGKPLSAWLTLALILSVMPWAGAQASNAPAPAAPAAVTITATKSDQIQVDGNGNSKADPGDTLRYTVVIANSGATDATGVVFNDTLDANTALAGAAQTTPLARNDSYTAVGNVRIQVNAAGGLLANDYGVPAPTAVVVPSGVSAQGGNVTVAADGSFTYDPPAGFEGADTFTYSATNANGTDTATVTITVSGMIWFINNNPGACASACDGRLTHPFTTLAAFNVINNGSGNNPAANDNLFIHESGTGYAGPVTLLNGQKLIGQDATSTLATLTGLTPPSFSDPLPTMNSGNGTIANIISSGNGVVLGQNNQLYGFTAGNATGIAITGSNFGTLLVNDVKINTTGAGLSLTTGSFGATATFGSITSGGGATNVTLVGVGGTGNLGGGALSGATGNAFNVDGGGGTVSYSGMINNTAARSVNVVNKTGGTVTLAGAVSGTGTGVFLNTNTGATISFTGGGMNLSTGANAAFTATGGGTVSVTGANNVLAATPGSALVVQNTTIGAAGLAFRSISSNGGSNTGIILDTTGASGGLTVSGSGAAGSGGTIANKTGADGSTTTGVGIYLNSTRGPSFSYMQINDHQNFAILGNNVTEFTLANSIVSGANGTNDGIDEASVAFNGLFGTAAISSSTIRGGVEDNFRVVNTSGTLNSLAITGSTFRDNHSTTGNDGVFIGARNNAIMTVSITGGTFTANRGDHFQADAANNSQLTVTFSGNTLTGGHPNPLGQTVLLTVDHSALITFNIANNSINGAILTAIQLFQSNQTTAGTRFSGQISGNTIGTSGAAGSGSAQGNGLGVTVTGLGTATVAISGNTIRQWSNLNGMQFTIGDTSAVMNATVTGNTLKEPNTPQFPGDGMFLNAGSTAAGTASVCFDFGGAGALQNDIVGSGYVAGGSSDFRVRQRNSSTVRLPGYGGSTTDTTAVINYIKGRNTAATSGTATVSSPPGGGFTGGAVCTQPTLPAAVVAAGAPNTAPEQQAAAVENAAESAEVLTPAAIPQATVETASGSADPAPVATLTDAAAQPQAPQADTVNLTIGTLPAGKSIAIVFDALIANPVPPDATQVSNQGTVSGSNFANVLTDDPDTAAPNDPTITPLNVLDTKRCGMSLNTPYSFNTGVPVVVTFANLGDVSCLQVVRTDSNSPNATPELQTGRYWQITATKADNSPATGYDATLVLPHNGLADPKACRYTGASWDCARQSFDASTVTRAGVMGFSDWAVGSNVPTAVSLTGFAARGDETPYAGVLLAGGILGLGGLWLARRRRQTARVPIRDEHTPAR